MIEDRHSIKMVNEFILALNISGEGFSPDIFNQSLPTDMKGQERVAKSVSGEPLNKYWYYESAIPLENQPEELLNELIQSYSKYLDRLDVSVGDLTKYASIVGRFKSLSQIRGFFISKELIQTCNAEGFEIDIDLYN